MLNHNELDLKITNSIGEHNGSSA